MNTTSRSLTKKLSTIALSLILFVSIGFAQPAQAIFGVGDIVIDPTNLVQNTIGAINDVANHFLTYILNPLAWALSKSLLQSVVKSTVNSINKGPNGSAGYTTNLAADLKTAGDTAANSFIQQLQTNGSIKSPYQTAVATAVGNSYLQSTSPTGYFTQNAYTLNKYSSNPTALYNGDLVHGGGLTAEMNAWSNPANNPFGATMIAQNGLASVVENAKSLKLDEMNWGQGFASSRGTCNTTTTGKPTQVTSVAGINQVLTSLTSLSANSGCPNSPIKTPGATIKATLDKSLGSGVDSLVNTHTFGELLGSILSQLINQVVGSGGLSGTSKPSTSATTITNPVTGATATTPAGSTYFTQTDPTQTSINTTLSSQFSSTITQQITQLQGFIANWNIINNAALAANAALSRSACMPNAQSLIASTVQPVIQQASTEISLATSGITTLQNMQTQMQSIASSTSDQSATLSTISTSYTTLLGTLPSASDIAYAANQSQDSSGSTSTAPTLLTQMNQLSAEANRCGLGT